MKRPAFSKRTAKPQPSNTRIDPPDVAIPPPVNEIHAAVACVLEDDDRRASQVEFRDGGGDRQSFQVLGRFGDDDWVEIMGFFAVLVGRLDDIARNRGRRGVSDPGALHAAVPVVPCHRCRWRPEGR